MLLIVFGTRPEFLKIKPLVTALKNSVIEFKTLSTGQHKELLKEANADIVLDLPETDSGDRLNSLVGDMFLTARDVFDQYPEITHVLVQGDTSSAFAWGMAGFHRGKEIIHLEAGLRTSNIVDPFPEELNRQLISRFASINFCPTNNNFAILNNEQVHGKKFVVGNTALDNLVDYSDKIEYNHQILVTLHRRENHIIMDEWFKAVNELAITHSELEFILPIHPNPNVQKHRHILKNVNVINPLSHTDLLDLMVKCRMIITDGGGLQEEGSFLRKKVIVCRKTTERPEALHTTSELCTSPSKLFPLFQLWKDNYEVSNSTVCPFGDGKASEKIVQILEEYLK